VKLLAPLLLVGCAATADVARTPDERADEAPGAVVPATTSPAPVFPGEARAPLAATACSDEKATLGKRVQIVPEMTAKNAGAETCRTHPVSLGPAHTGAMPVVAGGPKGAIAAWQEDDNTVVARLLAADLEPRTPVVRVGRFEEPERIVVVPTARGGAVLVLSNESDAERWYVSFVGEDGAVLDAPRATGLDPEQLVRAAFATADDAIAVLQYPVYLPFGIPEDPKPILLAVVDRDHPSRCPLRVDLAGAVDSRDDTVIVDGPGGPGFVVRYVEGLDSELPPLGEALAMRIHPGGAKKNVAIPERPAQRLEMLLFLGSSTLLRMTPFTVGTPSGTPIDLAPHLGTGRIDPNDIAITWTGTRAAAAVRAGDEARLIAVDCTP
jgi:hypothetical protein